MKTISKAITIIALSATAIAAQAGGNKDCLLEGTVYKSERGGEESTQVKFHSVSKYDADAKCRVRRNEKMQFKLPEDPRLENAPEGSAVKYRYREEEGNSSTELISIGT
jgi:hypothetical protein